jgi:putative aldouronate transport system permease protein
MVKERNMQRESWAEKLFNLFNIVFMSLLALTTVYPLLYVALASVSNPSQLMAHFGPLWRSLGFTLGSYQLVLQNPYIYTGYRNTIFVVVIGLLFNIIMTTIGAYFLSRKNVMWRNPVMFLIVFSMFFSGGIIPFYLTVRGLHIYNTLWALILPVAINTFNLIIMRTQFAAIPDSMEESAVMDGAGHFTILFQIMIPLSLPTVAVIVLYYAVQHWNAWFNAMIFLQNKELYPLQLILREIMIQNDSSYMVQSLGAGEQEMYSETIKYAVVIVATLPILLLYPFLQKYFVKGVMVGALKE